MIHDDFVPDPRDRKWGQLRVALTEGMGIYMGQSELVFALYSSGRVLFALSPTPPWQPRKYASLSPEQVRALLDELPLDRIGRYRQQLGQGGADGYTACIHVWSPDGHHRDCNWGGFTDQTIGKHSAFFELGKIWTRLADFDVPGAKPWVPDTINVALFPYDVCYTPPPATKWPTAWPRPLRNESKAYPRLFATASIPGTALEWLERNAAAGSRGSCPGAFAVDGLPYQVETRVHLPSDRAWETRPAPGHGSAPIFEASSAAAQNELSP